MLGYGTLWVFSQDRLRKAQLCFQPSSSFDTNGYLEVFTSQSTCLHMLRSHRSDFYP